MNDDVRAAAERVRRVDVGEDVEVVYRAFVGKYCTADQAWDYDRFALADAYLAEHPAAPDAAGPDLGRLAAIAEKATPGPWYVANQAEADAVRLLFGEASVPKDAVVIGAHPQDRDTFAVTIAASEMSPENAAYIAAFDPPTAKALLALARRGRDAGEVERLRAERDEARLRLLTVAADRLAILTAAGETDRLCCCGHSASDHDGGDEAGWGICNLCVCQTFRPATPPPVPAAGEKSDFLAFMADELDRFPCLHGPAGNGAHAKTAPMMWPELIRCIVAKAKQDAHPATPPPVPAEVVEAGERLQRHETAMATVGPTKSPYWQGHGWIGRPPGEVADLATVARAYVAELVARHVLRAGEG